MRTIAIVGKPNVGKSSLFNRILGKRQSIVDDQPGVTRDRIYGYGSWLTRQFLLIDTGGITSSKNTYQDNINEQVLFALHEANSIIFLLSAKDGIDNDDRLIAKILKEHAKSKQVILVVNKIESEKYFYNQSELYSLGFGKAFSISAEHGIGMGDLLDHLIQGLDPIDPNEQFERFKFCIIGRPNVGKSSLTNAILNDKRMIVNPNAGSTRDSIDNDFKYNNQLFTIIDTAGIRRRGKVVEAVEKYAVLRTQKAIERAQLILFVIDGSESFKEQDEVVGGLAHKANIPTIIVVNKWDAIANKTTHSMSAFIKQIRSQFKYLAWAPIVFVSALDNKRIHTIFETMDKVREQATKKISTSMLNEVVIKANTFVDPPPFKGGRINISYCVQVPSQIPTFVLKCNNPKYLHFSYARYIENEIRKAFGFDLVPITLYWQDKNKKERISYEK